MSLQFQELLYLNGQGYLIGKRGLNKEILKLERNLRKKHLPFYFKMFILKAVLVIKRNVMITEQIRTLEYIQELLVYSSSSKTTEIYTHVSKNAISKIKNPVDDFFE